MVMCECCEPDEAGDMKSLHEDPGDITWLEEYFDEWGVTAWPDVVYVRRAEIGDARRYVRERTATKMVRTYGAIGRCSCSECGMNAETSDWYCHACGARFVGTHYEKVGSK